MEHLKLTSTNYILPRMWKRIAASNGNIGKAYDFASLYKGTRGHNPVLVWSLGKVGTTSLASVIESTVQRPVLHCHRLTRESRNRVASFTYRPAVGGSRVGWRGEYARAAIALGGRRRTWDIVCGVRDPIARSASAVFQIGDGTGWLDEVEGTARLSSFAERVDELFASERAGLDWFSVELESVTGINVYSEPFDFTRGYKIYAAGQFACC